MYDLQKSSLALVSQFSAENVEELITNKKWSVQDKQIFGEYVISILALAGLCHDTLKKDFKRHCLEKVSMNKMKNGRAKEYFVGFVDTKKIVFEILLKYFKTGYYLNIVNPTNDQDDYPFCFLEAQVESLKEFVASQKETFQTQYHQRKSSLALMSQFAAKNLIRNLIADKKWFEDERKMFGEYVISILALTGLCHDTLKDHFDRKQLPKNLVNKIRSGNAKEFLVGFCDAEDISYRIVQKYFKSTK